MKSAFFMNLDHHFIEHKASITLFSQPMESQDQR